MYASLSYKLVMASVCGCVYSIYTFYVIIVVVVVLRFISGLRTAFETGIISSRCVCVCALNSEDRHDHLFLSSY